MRFRIAPLIAAFVVLAFSKLAWGETIIAQSGYRVVYDVYPGNGPAVLIFMHGKNGGHRAPLMKTFAERVSQAGFTIYLPLMPWSRNWDGTVADANSLLDALVERAAGDGKRIFVGGQSLGANFTMVYRPNDPHPAIVGKAMLNPGGLLDLTSPNATAFWNAIMPSVEKARQLERDGKGKEKTKFSGTNVQGEKSIEEHYETTPEIFLSFHDVERYPSNRAALRATKIPVFWSSGKKDPIQTAKRQSFNLVPANPANVYLEPDGNHNTAMISAIDPLIAWMTARLGP